MLPEETKRKIIELAQQVLHLTRAGLWWLDTFQTSKPNQSTRVVKTEIHYTIRPFERTPGPEVDWKSLEVWEMLPEETKRKIIELAQQVLVPHRTTKEPTVDLCLPGPHYEPTVGLCSWA